MTKPSLNIVILGLSITSSWGNGHATTYRGLVRELAGLGHQVLFLERDVPWYAGNRDYAEGGQGRIQLYRDIDDLRERFGERIAVADFVMVGSYVPEGIAVGEFVLDAAQGIAAFYDIDTPVTLAKLARGDAEYLSPELIPRYDLYLSFTGGLILERLKREYGSPCALPLYCSVDSLRYFPEEAPISWDLGYLGTYSPDRQPKLERLLLDPARRWQEGAFIAAGPQYPEKISWPKNCKRVEHLSPAVHREFYNAQRFTLNVTRADMVAAGYSPSVRLFEAAACGTPIISDHWEGLETFFRVDEEILVSRSTEETLGYLRTIPESRRRDIGRRARKRILKEHTAAHRARELEGYVFELIERSVGTPG